MWDRSNSEVVFYARLGQKMYICSLMTSPFAYDNKQLIGTKFGKQPRIEDHTKNEVTRAEMFVHIESHFPAHLLKYEIK